MVLVALALLALTVTTAVVTRAVRQHQRDAAAAVTSPGELAPLTPQPSRTGGPPSTVDLRTFLLAPPAGATLDRPDRAFTEADIPTDLVWQSLRNRGFVRGVSRQWTDADGTSVTIVLFQFQTTDEAYAFTANSHEELGRWPGCPPGTEIEADATTRAQIYVCPALTAQDRPALRATLFRYELAGYVVVRTPDSRSTPDTAVVVGQASLLG